MVSLSRALYEAAHRPRREPRIQSVLGNQIATLGEETHIVNSKLHQEARLPFWRSVLHQLKVPEPHALGGLVQDLWSVTGYGLWRFLERDLDPVHRLGAHAVRPPQLYLAFWDIECELDLSVLRRKRASDAGTWRGHFDGGDRRWRSGELRSLG